MSVEIAGVEAGSAAFRAGLRAGDTLLRIDGHPIRDVLDYRFYMMVERPALEWRDKAGTPRQTILEKEQYEDLGLEFDTYLMDQQKSCKNKCIFCFVDQLPGGMRESLYFKDDDSRMSFLFGNYVTLTNLTDEDIDRILAMHISPINISVHTTNPELRVRMMKNPRSGETLRYIPMLTEGGILVNTQLVLCPGVNDGPELERSLRELCALAPGVQSVAVVPVGLTSHREGLPSLRPFTREEARDVIGMVNRFGDRMREEHSSRICFAADELYLKAGLPIPDAEFYEDFPQLENGVGLLALLEDEFRAALEDSDRRSVERRVTVATGVDAAPLLRRLCAAAEARFSGLRVEVAAVENRFFGPGVTVAGLVTGGDLLEALAGRDLGDELLFPAVMLRREGDLFLDGMSWFELSEKLGVPVRAVSNDGEELLRALTDNS